MKKKNKRNQKKTINKNWRRRIKETVGDQNTEKEQCLRYIFNFNCNVLKKIRVHYNIVRNTKDSSNVSISRDIYNIIESQTTRRYKTESWLQETSTEMMEEGEGFIENQNLVGMHTFCLFVPAYLESGLFSRWTARGTKVNPRVWRRPKLMVEGEESEVLNLETAETSPSMDSFSTSINESPSLFWVACLRCLCFLDKRPFLKNSNEVGNLCLSTRCCCRLL